MAAITTYAARPSSARVAVLDDAVPRGRGSPYGPRDALVWPDKDPADLLDYVLDATAAVAGNEGDALATLSVAIAPNAVGDLTLLRSEVDGTAAVLWLAAGQAGTTYAVTVSMVTNAGRAIQRTVSLSVAALSTPPTGASALVTDAGSALTDQAGNAVTTA